MAHYATNHFHVTMNSLLWLYKKTQKSICALYDFCDNHPVTNKIFWSCKKIKQQARSALDGFNKRPILFSTPPLVIGGALGAVPLAASVGLCATFLASRRKSPIATMLCLLTTFGCAAFVLHHTLFPCFLRSGITSQAIQVCLNGASQDPVSFTGKSSHRRFGPFGYQLKEHPCSFDCKVVPCKEDNSVFVSINGTPPRKYYLTPKGQKRAFRPSPAGDPH